MRLLLSFLLIGGLGFGQIPEDESVRTLKQRLTARRQFLQNNPRAREIFRSENAIHFEREPGRRTAIIQRDVAYVDPDSGELKPVDLDLIETRLGYRTTGSPVVVRIVDGVLQTSRVQTFFKHPQTKTVYGYTLITPRLAYQGDFDFSFEQDGLNWTLQVQEFGWDIQATVSAPQGAKLYRFGFAELNMELAPDAEGNLATPDGLYKISRPVMIRADGVQTPCSAWQVERLGFRIGFTCDDTGFPAEAYPYVIDPTATFSANKSGDVYVLETTTDAYIYGVDCSFELPPDPTSASLDVSYVIGLYLSVYYENTGEYTSCDVTKRITNRFFRFDTRSLAGATITGASLNYYVDIWYTELDAVVYNRSGYKNNRGVGWDWITPSAWPPAWADFKFQRYDSFNDLTFNAAGVITDQTTGWKAVILNNATANIRTNDYTYMRGAFNGFIRSVPGPGDKRFGPYISNAPNYYPYLTVDYIVPGGPKLIIVQQGE